ncbi:hypothetical protein DIPPA_30166 [Diplonema papillatum]|nr:hypothetical protein DIPPA_30166 [Diplonema papillatum]
MGFCSTCGTGQPEGAAYCFKCGTSLVVAQGGAAAAVGWEGSAPRGPAQGDGGGVAARDPALGGGGGGFDASPARGHNPPAGRTSIRIVKDRLRIVPPFATGGCMASSETTTHGLSHKRLSTVHDAPNEHLTASPARAQSLTAKRKGRAFVDNRHHEEAPREIMFPDSVPLATTPPRLRELRESDRPRKKRTEPELLAELGPRARRLRVKKRQAVSGNGMVLDDTATVTEVTANGPTDIAGVRPGMRVLAIDGEVIEGDVVRAAWLMQSKQFTVLVDDPRADGSEAASSHARQRRQSVDTERSGVSPQSARRGGAPAAKAGGRAARFHEPDETSSDSHSVPRSPQRRKSNSTPTPGPHAARGHAHNPNPPTYRPSYQTGESNESENIWRYPASAVEFAEGDGCAASEQTRTAQLILKKHHEKQRRLQESRGGEHHALPQGSPAAQPPRDHRQRPGEAREASAARPGAGPGAGGGGGVALTFSPPRSKSAGGAHRRQPQLQQQQQPPSPAAGRSASTGGRDAAKTQRKRLVHNPGFFTNSSSAASHQQQQRGVPVEIFTSPHRHPGTPPSDADVPPQQQQPPYANLTVSTPPTMQTNRTHNARAAKTPIFTQAGAGPASFSSDKDAPQYRAPYAQHGYRSTTPPTRYYQQQQQQRSHSARSPVGSETSRIAMQQHSKRVQRYTADGSDDATGSESVARSVGAEGGVVGYKEYFENSPPRSAFEHRAAYRQAGGGGSVFEHGRHGLADRFEPDVALVPRTRQLPTGEAWPADATIRARTLRQPPPRCSCNTAAQSLARAYSCGRCGGACCADCHWAAACRACRDDPHAPLLFRYAESPNVLRAAHPADKSKAFRSASFGKRMLNRSRASDYVYADRLLAELPSA